MALTARVSLSQSQIKVLLKNLILSPDESTSFHAIRDSVFLDQLPVNEPLTEVYQTALMLACSRCKVGLIGLFLRKKADPNSTDADGNTAVHYCIKSRQSNVMIGLELLHAAEADFSMRNNSGEDALDLMEKVYGSEEEFEQYREIVTGYRDAKRKKRLLMLKLKYYALNHLSLV